MNQNEQIKILKQEIEELILTKNSFISDSNDLSTEIRNQKNKLRELSIKIDETVQNEKDRLKEINKEFIEELDTKQATLSKKDEWLFVLLCYLKVIINKSNTLSEFMEQTLDIVWLQEQLREEIEKFKIHNREHLEKLKEFDEIFSDLSKMLEKQSEVNEWHKKFIAIRESLRIETMKVSQEKETLEKQRFFLDSERKRIETEWKKIKTQWKVLGNTKTYLEKHGNTDSNDW